MMADVKLITEKSFNKTEFADTIKKNMKDLFLKPLSVIPYEPDTKAYFWTQQLFLYIAVSFTCLFIFYNTRTFGKLSILSSAFLAVLPLIDILPPVFVWYEYNTVTTLAVDPLSWVSAFLIIGAFIKLFNHVASLILVLKKEEIKEDNILVISFKILVEHKIIDDFFLKAIDFWLVYFYFSRFLGKLKLVNIS
jgi:hypothetical protein